MIPLPLIYGIKNLDILLTERDIPSMRLIESCGPVIDLLSIEQVVMAIQEVTTQVMQTL